MTQMDFGLAVLSGMAAQRWLVGFTGAREIHGLAGNPSFDSSNSEQRLTVSTYHHMAGSEAPPPTRPAAFTAAEEAQLRDALKRCSPATIEAALAFRRTGDPAKVPAIVIGVIERFLEPDMRARLKEGGDDLRVVEDLGVDSLTLMEIVQLAEDVLLVQISNDELRSLRTVGDIRVFVDCKVRGVPPPAPPRHVAAEVIATRMPHQAPFLFLEDAVLTPSEGRGTYRIRGDESFLQGHFKGNPVFPASILLEALGQLAVLYLLEQPRVELERGVDPSRILFTSCGSVRCSRVCRPGDILQLAVRPRRIRAPLATFEGSIKVGQEKAVFVEELTLSFAYAEDSVAAAGEAAADRMRDSETEAARRAVAAAPGSNGTHTGGRNGNHGT